MPVSEEEMKKIAEQLGLKISFGNENPGVYNTTTGEHKDLEDFFPEIKKLNE